VHIHRSGKRPSCAGTRRCPTPTTELVVSAGARSGCRIGSAVGVLPASAEGSSTLPGFAAATAGRLSPRGLRAPARSAASGFYLAARKGGAEGKIAKRDHRLPTLSRICETGPTAHPFCLTEAGDKDTVVEVGLEQGFAATQPFWIRRRSDSGGRAGQGLCSGLANALRTSSPAPPHHRVAARGIVFRKRPRTRSPPGLSAARSRAQLPVRTCGVLPESAPTPRRERPAGTTLFHRHPPRCRASPHRPSSTLSNAGGRVRPDQRYTRLNANPPTAAVRPLLERRGLGTGK